MKPVFCTIGGSMRNVCHIDTGKSVYPKTWPYDPKQTECGSIEEVRQYIKDTRMEFVMFGIRSNGIPNRAVSVNDTEKLDKAFKKLETLQGR